METLVDNILDVYNNSTELEKAEGMTWYADARKVCQDLAKKYKQPLEIVAYVCAALSPNNKWQRNLVDLERVLRLYNSGELYTKLMAYERGDKTALSGIACTYTSNVIKAFDILEERVTSKIGNGLKTNNFAQNIYHLKDDNVTIDFHAFSIANGVKHTVESIKSAAFRPKQYNEIANAYRTAAKKAGILPKQMQAITWVAWRNLHKVNTK